MDIVFFICVKNIFSFGFIEALDSKWNNKYAKNAKKGYYVGHGMRWCCSFHFRYVTNKIVFTVQVYFGISDGINLFAILWVFLVGFGKWSKFFGCFIAAS